MFFRKTDYGGSRNSRKFAVQKKTTLWKESHRSTIANPGN